MNKKYTRLYEQPLSYRKFDPYSPISYLLALVISAFKFIKIKNTPQSFIIDEKHTR